MFTKEQQELIDKEELHSYEDILHRIYDEVLFYNEYGSYQGDWLAKVKKGDEEFWLWGWYGSCSGCDWFQAEADYPWSCDFEDTDFDYFFEKVKEETKRLIKSFVDDYEADKFTKEELIAHLEKSLKEWDDGQREMLEDVKKN